MTEDSQAPNPDNDEQHKPLEALVAPEPHESLPPGPTTLSLPPHTSRIRPWWVLGSLLGVVLIGLLIVAFAYHKSNNLVAQDKNSTPSAQQALPTGTAAQQTNLSLSTSKNYGDKYANGLLPVGDNHYVTTGAKKGYIYLCNANFVPAGQAGAQVRGPWFTNNNAQWDLNKKSKVQGNVNWKPSISMKLENGKRVITTNDLPDHHTGVFPIASSDPAYKYDKNPSTISAQTLTYNLSGAPTAGSPQCMGGEVGVMVTGVALFNGFDAGGRDAGAWEVQDTCDGHPQNKGEYHYHTLSSCIKDTSISTVIGYALDGFPITGPKVGAGNILTTDDLDECHGLTSDIMLDGKKVTMYHYVMTQDFPYSVSCFRSSATQPPGQHELGGTQQSGGQTSGQSTMPAPVQPPSGNGSLPPKQPSASGAPGSMPPRPPQQ